MSATRVSVVIPAGHDDDLEPVLGTIARYLDSIGFEFELLPSRDEQYGVALRRGLTEANGDTVIVVDPDLPYPLTAIGDAIAMIQSGMADLVLGCGSRDERASHVILRWWLVPMLPDPSLLLKAFTARAAHLLGGESKMTGGGIDLELAFLANKYGLRVERLVVHQTLTRSRRRTFGALSGLGPAVAIRVANRNNGYRASRRCPVCFSDEVWTCGQLPRNLVRFCKRCKCRYLNQFAEEDETPTVRRVLRAHPSNAEGESEETIHSRSAREKTSMRRLAALRGHLSSRGRVLEVGVRDGSFGAAAAREFEYVGIDRAAPTARAARARDLEVYCASLANFVNTGPAFDAIALFHVFENMPDPHDALGRINDLLKPGGVLFLTTRDTEGLRYLFSEKKRMAQNFRTHLILYSRSALIELLEHSGFEIVNIGPDFEYRDYKFLRYRIDNRMSWLAPLARTLLRVLPDPLLLSSGSLRIMAKRRGGQPPNVRAIRSAEPTHAR